MTFSKLQKTIDFQSEVRFSVYDYEKDELVALTQEAAQHREIKYIYPISESALMVEVEED